MSKQTYWKTIGKKRDLVPGSGVGARLGKCQIALFWIPDMDDRVFAINNYCPFSGVHILARGIVGDVEGEPVVATPLYKQHFSLIDGRCIEHDDVAVDAWEARFEGDEVQVQVSEADELAA
ncbi:MAG: nitrite reductase small subunit NirD [Oleiphilaceae bacterium]|nr:nitrite reductase small subunit NirD [Oleiphilaceae bacterium]